MLLLEPLRLPRGFNFNAFAVLEPCQSLAKTLDFSCIVWAPWALYQAGWTRPPFGSAWSMFLFQPFFDFCRGFIRALEGYLGILGSLGFISESRVFVTIRMLLLRGKEPVLRYAKYP